MMYKRQSLTASRQVSSTHTFSNKCIHTPGNMAVLRSVMFCLLTVSLIMGITPMPAPTVDQSQISHDNISSLNDMLKSARVDANLTFRNNVDTGMPSPFHPPIFQEGKQTTEELLQEIYSVCISFTNMLKLFRHDVKGQMTASLLLVKDLDNLNNSVFSIELFLQQLIPDLQEGNKTVNICKSKNPTLRNTKNLQTVARMAMEMDKMSKALS